METKRCTGCGNDLPVTDFYFQNRATGSLRSRCKKCFYAEVQAQPNRRKYARDRKRANYHNDIEAGREKSRKDSREQTAKRKDAVFKQLGDCCQRCPEADPLVLHIDHIHGGGNQHRKQFASHYALLKHVLEDTTGTYQLLCVNCNWLKRLENTPPPATKAAAWTRKHSQKRKREALAVLGGQCVDCGRTNPDILQLDHINGGGNQDRLVTGRGVERYNDAIKHGRSKYQLLCGCCNWRKRHARQEWGKAGSD